MKNFHFYLKSILRPYLILTMQNQTITKMKKNRFWPPKIDCNTSQCTSKHVLNGCVKKKIYSKSTSKLNLIDSNCLYYYYHYIDGMWGVLGFTYKSEQIAQLIRFFLSVFCVVTLLLSDANNYQSPWQVRLIVSNDS